MTADILVVGSANADLAVLGGDTLLGYLRESGVDTALVRTTGPPNGRRNLSGMGSPRAVLYLI
jgi:hypothetical protein